jgi:GNAT superfamily N-acetyltransferase
VKDEMMKEVILQKDEFRIRATDIDDAGLVLSYIKKIASYEKLSDLVVADVEDIKRSIFEKKQAEVVIAEVDGNPIGFMLYFFSYSTFWGRANLYLEDLFIDEAYRHQGYGKLMFKALAKIAVKNECKRIDWMCLDWNQKSIEFYQSIGAKPLNEWITFRLEDQEINKLIK